MAYEKLADVRADLMPDVNEFDTVTLKTNRLPKRVTRGEYIKEIDSYTPVYIDNEPPTVPEPEQAGKAAGHALALAGRDFRTADALKLAPRNPYNNDADVAHVIAVVNRGRANKGKVEHYGKVPADFTKWVEAYEQAAQDAYDADMTPEAQFDRWRTAMVMKHPDMVEYVGTMLDRFRAELLAEIADLLEADK